MSIYKQQDDAITSVVNKSVMNLYKTFGIKLGGVEVSTNDLPMSQRNYDRYNRTLKVGIVDTHMNTISDVLSKRFGIKIKLEYLKSNLKSVTSLVMPIVNYKLMNVAMQSLDELFPNKHKDKTLWLGDSNNRETRVYKILNDIKNGLSKGSIEIDLKNAYIKGIDEATFVINVDVLGAMVLGVKEEELTAALFHQVGKIFSYIEYMTSTTNNTKVLADTFLKERFGKSKDPIESLRLAVASTDVDAELDTSTPIKVLESLDSFILATYRVNTGTGSIHIDFQRVADQFSTRFGMGQDLASFLAKMSNADIEIDKEGGSYMATGAKGVMLTILSVIAVIVAGVLFSIIGLVVMITYLTVRLISYLLALVAKFIAGIFNLLLTRGTDKATTMEDVGKRLKHIELELIRELRTTNTGDKGKAILVEQISNIKGSIKSVSEKFTILGGISSSTTSLSYSKMDDISFLTEQLQENELHLLKEKFNLEG